MIDQDTIDRAGYLLDVLRRLKKTICTAESCTGGLVAAALTHHAGSSSSVFGGFVTYSNEMKRDLLGVDPAILQNHGAVSGEVAAAMANGARRRSGANIALSITGIAGPSGATPGKPVGLVWFGLSGDDAGTHVGHMVFSGDRQAVRQAAVRHALVLLEDAAAR